MAKSHCARTNREHVAQTQNEDSGLSISSSLPSGELAILVMQYRRAIVTELRMLIFEVLQTETLPLISPPSIAPSLF